MALNSHVKQAMSTRETSSTVLLVLAVDLLGPEVLQWDPATIRAELEELNGSETFPLSNFNKLMAAIEIVTSDSFYTSLPDFIRLCNVLYNGTIDLESFDPADAAEIAWGITEALLIWPPEPQEERPFDDKIIQYIGYALKDEGIMVPPDVLRLGVTGGENIWERVQGTFSDDPEMFAAIFAVEKAKTEEINQLVKDRLRRLLVTLDSLPLNTGDAKDSVKNMLAAIQKTQEEGSKLESTM